MLLGLYGTQLGCNVIEGSIHIRLTCTTRPLAEFWAPLTKQADTELQHSMTQWQWAITKVCKHSLLITTADIY